VQGPDQITAVDTTHTYTHTCRAGVQVQAWSFLGRSRVLRARLEGWWSAPHTQKWRLGRAVSQE
jgi:hypothetical protein